MKRKLIAFVLSSLMVIGTVCPVYASPVLEEEPISNSKSTDDILDQKVQVGTPEIKEELVFDETDISLYDEVEAASSVSIDCSSELFNIEPLEGSENTTRAALADLTFGTVKTNYSQPYPSGTDVKFEVQIKNIGSAPATNMNISLYLDDKLQGVYEIQGTLGAGESGIFYSHVNIFGGSHSLKMILNENHAITESNYNNNTLISSGIWQSCIALSLDSLKAQNGTYEVHSMTSKVFEFTVTNRGNIPVEDGYVMYKVNGSPLKMSVLNLGAKKQVIGTIPFTFKAAGTYTIEIIVGPGNSQTDITPDDNAKSRNCKVIYDIELWSGRWTSAKNFDIQTFNDVYEVISKSDLKSAISSWNGIDSNVSFNTTAMTSVDRDLGATISIGTYIDEDESVLGITNLYKDDEKTGVGFVEDPENEVCVYRKANIGLNLNSDFPSLNTTYKKATVTHEFGHLLGLSHTWCNDKAIMVYDINSPLFMTSVQEHDKYNLKQKY